jgi:hypothetical protein
VNGACCTGWSWSPALAAACISCTATLRRRALSSSSQGRCSWQFDTYASPRHGGSYRPRGWYGESEARGTHAAARRHCHCSCRMAMANKRRDATLIEGRLWSKATRTKPYVLRSVRSARSPFSAWACISLFGQDLPGRRNTHHLDLSHTSPCLLPFRWDVVVAFAIPDSCSFKSQDTSIRNQRSGKIGNQAQRIA